MTRRMREVYPVSQVKLQEVKACWKDSVTEACSDLVRRMPFRASLV